MAATRTNISKSVLQTFRAANGTKIKINNYNRKSINLKFRLCRNYFYCFSFVMFYVLFWEAAFLHNFRLWVKNTRLIDFINARLMISSWLHPTLSFYNIFSVKPNSVNNMHLFKSSSKIKYLQYFLMYKKLQVELHMEFLKASVCSLSFAMRRLHFYALSIT